MLHHRYHPARLSVPIIAALVLLLTAFRPASAADVTGRVLDETGRPLAGATVVLRDVETGFQRYGTATDADGTFQLDRVQPGTYRLDASFVGYASERMTLEVAEGAAVERTIQLTATALPQQEVVIAATRAQPRLNPITFSNLTAAQLEELPEMKDLPVQLATLPSITYSSENGNGIGYTSLRMRGFGQRRLAVSINGIPQNDPEEHNVFWINFFDLQGSIDDIQVQRGASSAFYGTAAIGGAINIVAMPYKPYPYATVEAGYGAYDTQRYTAEANSGLLDDRYVVYGRFSRLQSDGYRDWSWTEFWRFFGGVTRYGDRSTLTLQAYGGPQRDGLAYVGIPKDANDEDDARTANFSAFTEDVEDFHQPHVELHHDLRINEDWSLKQALFWVKGEGYFDFGGSFRSADYLRLPADYALTRPETCYGFPVGAADDLRALPLDCSAPQVEQLLFRAYLDQWQVGWLPRVTYRHATGTTTLGAEARLHRSLRWGRIEEAVGVPADLVGDSDVRVYSVRGEKAVASVFGSHLFRPVDRIAVQGDLQLTYRHYRVFDEAFFGTSFTVPYVFVNPRLGVTFNPERPLSGYVSVALANREPRMKSLYDGEEAGAGFQPQFEQNADGSFDFDAPIVEPERLLDVELGGTWTQPRYRVAANVFYMDFWDEIVPSGGLDQFGVPRTGNADRTRHVGLELEAAARLAPGLDVEANATLSRNRFVEFTEFGTGADFAVVELERDGNPIAGFPEQVGYIGATYQRHGLTAALHVKYNGKQYIDNSGGELADGTTSDDLSIESYTMIDASLRYRFGDETALGGLSMGVDVNNVLDARVLTYGNVGAAGPQFFPAATRHAYLSLRYTIR